MARIGSTPDTKFWLAALVRLSTFGILGVLWYWPSRRAGWVTDILGLAPRLTEANGLAGAWTGYGAPVFHPLTLGLHYVLWHTGGPLSLLYFVVWTGLHALTAWLVAECLRGLVAHFRLPNAVQSGWLAGLAFLIYPYVVEAVVWRATLNYLLCVPLLLALCGWGFAFAKTGRKGCLATAVASGVLALLSFDLAWTAPLLAGLAGALGAAHLMKRVMLRRVGILVGTQALTLAVYLLVKARVIGTAVGHYGAEVHLVADPKVLIPNAWRALTKLLFLTRELSFGDKQSLDALLGETWIYASITLLALAFLALWIWRLARRSARWLLVGALFIGALVAIAPIANLYQGWILSSEGDRFNYLPAAWLLAALAVAWGGISGSWLRYGTAAGALLIYGYFNRQLVISWAEASYAQRLLLDAFPADPPGEVYVLAAADNYRGTYLFRDNSQPYNSMDYNVRYLRNWSRPDTIQELVNFNQLNLEDSLSAVVNDRGEIELRFRQGGNWFWRAGIGLSSYERPEFRVTAGDPVRICFTEPVPTTTLLLYPTGRTWTALPHEGLRTCREIGTQ